MLSPEEQAAVHRILKEEFHGATPEWSEKCLNSLQKQGIQNKIKNIKVRLGAPDLPSDQIGTLTKELLDLQTQRNDIA